MVLNPSLVIMMEVGRPCQFVVICRNSCHCHYHCCLNRAECYVGLLPEPGFLTRKWIFLSQLTSLLPLFPLMNILMTGAGGAGAGSPSPMVGCVSALWYETTRSSGYFRRRIYCEEENYILLTSGGWLVSWLLNNDKYSPWITVGLLNCCRTDWTLCVDCGLQAGSQRRKEKAGELRCLRCEISCHDRLQTPQLLHHHI